MPRYMLWLGGVGLLAVLLVATPLMAEEDDEGGHTPRKQKTEKVKKEKKPREGGAEKAPKSAIRGTYEQIAKDVGLSEAQRAEFEAAIVAKNEAVKAWDAGADGQKLADLKKQAGEARKAKDKETADRLREEMKPLEEARKTLLADREAAVMAVLTDEQRSQWATTRLTEGVLKSCRKMNLSESQQAEVRRLCSAAAAKGGDAKALQKDVMKQVQEEVLTDEQKAKPAKEGGEKKERGEKPEKPRKEKKSRGGDDDEGGEDKPFDDEDMM